MPRKKRKRRSPAGEGVYFSFHGAFTNEAKARAKAKARDGWVVKRYLRGQQKPRFIVLAERVPF